MAPEQFRGDPSDPSTDQFAFALVVFEALYGIEPFEGATFQELCVAVLGDKLVAPPEDSAIPQPIRHAISRALSNSQSDRFPSMDALLAALAPAPPNGNLHRPSCAIGALALALGSNEPHRAICERSCEVASTGSSLAASSWRRNQDDDPSPEQWTHRLYQPRLRSILD